MDMAVMAGRRVGILIVALLLGSGLTLPAGPNAGQGGGKGGKKRAERVVEKPVVVPPRFLKRLEAANGTNRSLSGDEIEAVRKALGRMHKDVAAARTEFGKVGSAATGLTPDEVIGALPVPGGSLSPVDRLITDKAAKQGKRLSSEAVSDLRAALRDYGITLDEVRDEMIADLAEAVDLRKSQIEDILPEDGFPGMLSQ
jgi:hypothetical protein